MFTCGAGAVLAEGEFDGVLELLGAATGGEVKHCCSNVVRQIAGKTALQHSKLGFEEISQFVNVSRKS